MHGIYGIWIDMDSATGRYKTFQDEEPKKWTGEELEKDHRIGTSACFVGMAPDHSWAEVEYYDTIVHVKWAPRKQWRPILDALIASVSAIENYNQN